MKNRDIDPCGGGDLPPVRQWSEPRSRAAHKARNPHTIGRRRRWGPLLYFHLHDGGRQWHLRFGVIVINISYQPRLRRERVRSLRLRRHR